ncbi:MAG: hypothetical protein MH186_11225 [Marinobacter sp.]|nr:hypothetical protein [Marinobacter sp.]
MTAEVSEDGKSVIFKNAGLTAVNADIDISDASGDQITVSGTDFSTTDGSTTQSTATLFDPIDLNLASGVTGSFTVTDDSSTTTTVNFSLAAGAGNTLADLTVAVQTGLTAAGFVAGTGNDLGAADDSSVIQIQSDSSITYDLASITASDGGTADASVGSSVSTLAPAVDQTVASAFEAGDTISFSLDIAGEAVTVDEASSLRDVVAQINASTKDTGVSGFLNSTGEEIVFASAKGADFTVSITTDVDGTLTAITGAAIDTAGDNAADVSLNSLDISTREGSDQTLVAIDFAIDQINQFRSDLGAVQNRFESTIANLSTSVENLSAANSRILDADFASETAALAKSQVLQQARHFGSGSGQRSSSAGSVPPAVRG